MNKSPITRSCLACGLEKPLAAYLQLSGAQGTMYGNICSDCRNESAKNKPIPVDIDEEESGGSGLRIDSKTKVQKDTDRKTFDKKKKELALEELKDQEEISDEKLDRQEIKEKAEKYHRKEFLDKKKRGFLDQNKQLNTRATIDKAFIEKNILLKHGETIESAKLDAVREHEFKQTTTDFSSGVSIDPSLAGLRFQMSESLRSLKTILGSGAFLNRMQTLYGAKQDKPSAQKKPTTDPLVDFVKENLSQKKRGR